MGPPRAAAVRWTRRGERSNGCTPSARLGWPSWAPTWAPSRGAVEQMGVERRHLGRLPHIWPRQCGRPAPLTSRRIGMTTRAPRRPAAECHRVLQRRRFVERFSSPPASAVRVPRALGACLSWCRAPDASRPSTGREEVVEEVEAKVTLPRVLRVSTGRLRCRAARRFRSWACAPHRWARVESSDPPNSQA